MADAPLVEAGGQPMAAARMHCKATESQIGRRRGQRVLIARARVAHAGIKGKARHSVQRLGHRKRVALDRNGSRVVLRPITVLGAEIRCCIGKAREAVQRRASERHFE